MNLNYFNFKKLQDKVLLTNDLGNYIFIEEPEFKALIAKKIDTSSDLGKRLLQLGFIYDESILSFTENNYYTLQNTKSYIAASTSLHIFVVTTACNMNCVYCQANNGVSVPNLYMDFTTAEKAVDIALGSPTTKLSFEFQGGEPLLNFKTIQHIVEYAESIKKHHLIDYNLVSNLTLLNDEMLSFFKEHHFNISTSVDGDIITHNSNRPMKDGSGSFEKLKNSIEKVKNYGITVGAIETTTRNSLDRYNEIIDTYLDLGFNSIFIRPLTQLGKANKSWDKISYSANEFLEFYKKIINRLIDINKSGIFIKEEHSAIFLRKISKQRVNYMELRSPCGGGIGQLAYFADGKVFTCDEGRMLSEMGNNAFKLGNVYSDSYKDIINNKTCRTVCASSILETIPSCCDCVYQPYCGTCPVVNYATSDDIIEKSPRSFRCKIYGGILDYLFGLILNNDSITIDILKKWGE